MGYDLNQDGVSCVHSHSRAISLHPCFRLSAAVEIDIEKREAFRKFYSAPAYATLSEAFLNHKIDVAIIATSTQVHCDVVRDILRLTKPKVILCEKPLGSSAHESREITALCKERGVLLYVNYIRCSEPGAVEVGHRISSNKIVAPVNGFAYYAKGLIHNGSHFFNLVQLWLGEMKAFRVIKKGATVDKLEANPNVSVEFEKGNIVFLSTNSSVNASNKIELVAQNGRLLYANSGYQISWHPKSNSTNQIDNRSCEPKSEQINSELNRYQWNVVDQLALALNNQSAHLCDGDQALITFEALSLIVSVEE